jgi:hypothetical protein
MIFPLVFAVVVTGVGECIRAEMPNTLGGMPSRYAPLLPGNEIAWDCCDQLALIITQEAPTKRFPIDSSNDIDEGGCGPRSQMANCIASIQRCVPTMNDRGIPPRPESLYQAALIQQSDAYWMDRAIRCCLYAMQSQNPRMISAFRVGPTQFLGPSGACSAVVVPFSFQVV